jgi:hypothetical protein
MNRQQIDRFMRGPIACSIKRVRVGGKNCIPIRDGMTTADENAFSAAFI